MSRCPTKKGTTMEKTRMENFAEWLHESVKGKSLEIVKITDYNKTVLGLKDSGSDEVFIIGSTHDLTFILHGKEDGK
jgi:hypothetical protein